MTKNRVKKKKKKTTDYFGKQMCAPRPAESKLGLIIVCVHARLERRR